MSLRGDIELTGGGGGISCSNLRDTRVLAYEDNLRRLCVETD
jgi:hypothetical protein